MCGQKRFITTSVFSIFSMLLEFFVVWLLGCQLEDEAAGPIYIQHSSNNDNFWIDNFFLINFAPGLLDNCLQASVIPTLVVWDPCIKSIEVEGELAFFSLLHSEIY